MNVLQEGYVKTCLGPSRYSSSTSDLAFPPDGYSSKPYKCGWSISGHVRESGQRRPRLDLRHAARDRNAWGAWPLARPRILVLAYLETALHRQCTTCQCCNWLLSRFALRITVAHGLPRIRDLVIDRECERYTGTTEVLCLVNWFSAWLRGWQSSPFVGFDSLQVHQARTPAPRRVFC
jgi:hypothetical protein